MSNKAQLDPRSFPRPPKLEQIPRHLQVKWKDQLIADTKEAYWVLETFHPPTYYLPKSALKVEVQPSSARQTYCEWKGRATYWNLTHPQTNETVKSRIWSYEDPNPSFKDIKGYLCFYVEPWDCFVDGEKVVPQPGDYYGGWVTQEILGDWVKGAPGTTHWRMLRTRCLRQPLRHLRGDGVSRLGPATRADLRYLTTLAIESSCDDTSVAVLEKDDLSGRATLHFHEKVTSDNKVFKGVNPKIALQSHEKSLAPLVQKALASLQKSHNNGNSNPSSKALDFITVTRGPGLRSSVSTGLSMAKGLAIALNVPLVGVNHMQAHALTPRLVSALEGAPQVELDFPFISLLVSGGHTMVLSSESLTSHKLLANTVDIAAGDALDKMARLILPEDVLEVAQDVSYARILEKFVFGTARPNAYDYTPPATRTEEITPRQSAWGWALPVPLANTRGGQKMFNLDMTFTGLNSAVERICLKSQAAAVAIAATSQPSNTDTDTDTGTNTSMTLDERKHLGYEAMRITFEHIALRVILSLESLETANPTEITTLVCSGGVAANNFLRFVLRKVLDSKGYAHIALKFPPLEFCTDNAAMIAWAGMEMYEAGWRSRLDCLPLRKWSLDPGAEDGGIFGVGGWERRE